MKKFMFIAMMLVASMASTLNAANSEFVLDQRMASRDASTYFGVMTRFGYSFSDNGYFAYGASIYYTFSSILGVTAGFDGYSGRIFVMDENNNMVQYDGAYKSLPMWDVRAGITLGKYVSFGAIYGQCKVCTGDQHVVHSNKYGSQNLTTELTKNGSFFGAFGTIIAPISTHVAIDFDLSYTNHTSFTLSAGLIVRLKVK